MRQAYAWELDQPIPTLLYAVESNLKMPGPFFFLATLPILLAVLFSCLTSNSLPPIISFFIVSILCYLFANGAIVVLILLSQLLFYVAGTIHVFVKQRLVVLFMYVTVHACLQLLLGCICLTPVIITRIKRRARLSYFMSLLYRSLIFCNQLKGIHFAGGKHVKGISVFRFSNGSAMCSPALHLLR